MEIREDIEISGIISILPTRMYSGEYLKNQTSEGELYVSHYHLNFINRIQEIHKLPPIYPLWLFTQSTEPQEWDFFSIFLRCTKKIPPNFREIFKKLLQNYPFLISFILSTSCFLVFGLYFLSSGHFFPVPPCSKFFFWIFVTCTRFFVFVE